MICRVLSATSWAPRGLKDIERVRVSGGVLQQHKSNNKERTSGKLHSELIILFGSGADKRDITVSSSFCLATEQQARASTPARRPIHLIIGMKERLGEKFDAPDLFQGPRAPRSTIAAFATPCNPGLQSALLPVPDLTSVRFGRDP